MATLDEIQRAGLKPDRGGAAEQIFSLLQGVRDDVRKKREKERDDVMEQVKLYNSLREVGYSKEDAHERVTRSYRSTGFIQKMLTGETGNVFEAPAGEDKIGMEREKARLDLQKTKAEIGKTKADTRKSIATAGYYNRRKGTSALGDGYSISQKRGRINDLMKVDNPFGIYSDDTEAANAAKQEIASLNDEIASLSSKAPGAGAPAAKFKVGQKVKYKGQTRTISKINEDGTYEIA